MWNDYEDDEYDDGSLGSLMLRARAGKPNLEKQIQDEADGLMADEARANAWHPPQVMPNTPRDPDKEAREQAAMKAFLANGGGPSFGRKPQSPMSSVHPSQNPFSEQTASPEEQASVAGRMMQSQIPQALPVQSVQDASFDTPEGFPPNPLDAEPPRVAGPERGPPASPAPAADPARDRLMALLEANQQSDDSAGLMARRNLDDRMSAVSQQNANLDFMKLLMRNAAQMGQIGGKVASTQAFDDNIDSMQGRNTQAEQRYISTMKDARSQADDRKKTLLALLKMDQDAALRREGFDVQRENNTEMRKYREGMLEAAQGRDANAMNLGNRRIDADIAAREASAGHQGRALNETIRHNQAMEETARKKAEADAAKAARNGDHLPLGMKERVLKLSNIQAQRSSSLNKIKTALKTLKGLKDPKAKYDYAKTLLKMVNSLEGQDAVGAEEAKRFGANLDNFRAEDILMGANPFGKNFDAFEDMVQNQINAMEANYKADQAEIDSINRQYPSPKGVANPDLANPSPTPTGRRVISNFDDL